MSPTSSVRVLMLGAASGIAQATARLYAAEGAIIGLAGRNSGRLSTIAGDLTARGAARVETFEVDFTSACAGPELAGRAGALESRSALRR